MDAKGTHRPIITIGGQEVSLDASRQTAGRIVGQPADIQIALEPVTERVSYQVDRAPGRWGSGLLISLFVVVGLGAILGVVLLLLRALFPRR